MTIIPAVIAWAFTLTFLIALVLVLLDVAGIRQIRDRAQRKWLFRSLFGSVILAVVGFGTWQFEALKKAVDAPANPAPAASGPATAAVSPPATTPAAADRRDEPEHPAPAASDTGATAAAAVEPIPEAVRSWATQALGTRPVLASVVAEPYPTCAQRLGRRDPAQISTSESNACRQDVAEFHDSYILAYYNLKRPYDANLTEQERALRAHGLTADELPRWNYVDAEMNRLNDQEMPLIMEYEQRILDDKRRCASRRCGAAAANPGG